MMFFILFWQCCLPAFGTDICCGPGDECWPTQTAWSAFENSLSDANRNYAFPPVGEARAPFSQWPMMLNMKKVYHRPANQTTCYEELDFAQQSDFCKVSTVNKPAAMVSPAVVIWPASVGDVQKAVDFLRRNRLCLCVVGPANSESSRGMSTRNNCALLRTGVLRDMDWEPNDKTGGSVRLGAGLRFVEVYEAAEKQQRLVVGGNCPQVGVVGWLLGGGHSAYSPAYGLGVDNVLNIEMVSANGSALNITEGGMSLQDFGRAEVTTSNNTDLWWSLRGGGGGTWGVVTAVTYKAHLLPRVTKFYVPAIFPWLGEAAMKIQLGLYYDVSKLMGDKFSMYAAWVTVVSPVPATLFVAEVRYFGSNDDDACKRVRNEFRNAWKSNITEEHNHTMMSVLDTLYGAYTGSDDPISISLQPTTPSLYSEYGSAAATGMVDLRTDKHEFARAVAACFDASIRERIMIQVLFFNTWTGLSGEQAVGAEASTPLAYGTRNGIFEIGVKVPEQRGVTEDENKHFSASVVQPLLNNALASVYFSETQYTLPDWKMRYWGSDATVRRLEQIKIAWDPESLFGCRNCIGDTSDHPSPLWPPWMLWITGALVLSCLVLLVMYCLRGVGQAKDGYEGLVQQ